ncbi:MAG: endonuclease/exonuclease/phosphatase family protein [Alphaproteobacteria bacterium]|nr:endonuclease/exonuclease/phosphatase family protein [Alphaproteobacteria bacterium]
MSLRIVPAGASLSDIAASCDGVSLLSYNVLLPNSGDGWWVFKYYDGETPDAARSWSHRRALLARQILGTGADVVCLQEARAESFDADFAFLTEAGYAAEIHRKSMLRPATFWRTGAWEGVYTRHTDKVLGVILRARGKPERVLGVLNVHLTAGPDPQRRFRQVFDALDQLRKDLKRHGVAPEDAAVVVCGDFNAGPAGSATQHLLAGGTVDADFREPGWPDLSLSSKARQHAFSPFAEVYQQALGQPPVTLIGSQVAGLMAEGQPTERLIAAIEAMFERFAGADGGMDAAAIDAWIQRINRAPQRGSEHRKAAAVLAEAGRSVLSREDFVGVYRSELSEGKIWSVQHDLQSCGLLPEGARVPYTASLDRLYHTIGTLEAVAVWDPLTEARRQELAATGLGLPNVWHPSDHVPLGAVVRWGS